MNNGTQYPGTFWGGMKIAIAFFTAALLFPYFLQAQEYDSIAVRYKNQHAVITNFSRRMVIREEEGKLVANSYITQEKMLISDLAPGIHNRDYISHSDFNRLGDLDATVSVPTGSGYKRIPCNNFASTNPDRDNVFYDDSREIVVSYSG